MLVYIDRQGVNWFIVLYTDTFFNVTSQSRNKIVSIIYSVQNHLSATCINEVNTIIRATIERGLYNLLLLNIIVSVYPREIRKTLIIFMAVDLDSRIDKD